MAAEPPIFGKKLLSLCLRESLSKSDRNATNATYLSQFLCSVARETYQFQITEECLHISKSLEVPVSHIPSELLREIEAYLRAHVQSVTAEFIKSQNKFALCVSRPQEKQHVIGIVTLLCAFFMAITEAYGEITDVHMSIMDFLIEGALATYNISYDNVYNELTNIGYCRIKNASRPGGDNGAGDVCAV